MKKELIKPKKKTPLHILNDVIDTEYIDFLLDRALDMDYGYTIEQMINHVREAQP